MMGVRAVKAPVLKIRRRPCQPMVSYPEMCFIIVGCCPQARDFVPSSLSAYQGVWVQSWVHNLPPVPDLIGMRNAWTACVWGRTLVSKLRLVIA
jgi:hypothetical protein